MNGIPILDDKQYVLDNEVWLVGDNRKVIKRFSFNQKEKRKVKHEYKIKEFFSKIWKKL